MVITEIELSKMTYTGNSAQVATELFSLMSPTDESCKNNFLNLESLILDEDVREPKDYVQTIERALDTLHEVNFFNTTEKKRLLNKFRQEKLKIRER